MILLLHDGKNEPFHPFFSGKEQEAERREKKTAEISQKIASADAAQKYIT